MSYEEAEATSAFHLTIDVNKLIRLKCRLVCAGIWGLLLCMLHRQHTLSRICIDQAFQDRRKQDVFAGASMDGFTRILKSLTQYGLCRH